MIRRWTLDLLIAAALAAPLLAILLMGTSPAHGATWSASQCDEAWQAPRSAYADQCRDHGWRITSRWTVGPHGVVRAHLDPVRNDARGYYVPRRDGTRMYVWRANPYRTEPWTGPRSYCFTDHNILACPWGFRRI